MPETIKASEQNVVRIFSNDYLFEIPVFQRPYAWTTEQVDDLLDDLIFAMSRDNEEPYFLGSVVLIKGDSPDSQVVDGQQRLTTLTMLLCVLRELAEDEAVKSALDTRIRQQRDVLAGTKEVVRLGLRLQDREFFYENVQNSGGIVNLLENPPTRGRETDSQQRIFENVEHLHKALNELSRRRNAGSLASVRIILQCYMVIVATSDMTSAYRIFSVMNDRGLDLSATDILERRKSLAPLKAPGNQSVLCPYKWEDIEQELGREQVQRALFAHIRTVYAKGQAAPEPGQEEFREHVLKQHNATQSSLTAYSTSTTTRTRVYSGCTGGIINQHASNRNSLCWSICVDWTTWTGCRRRWPSSTAYPRNQDALERFTKDLERLAYGLFILRTYVTDRIRRYGSVLGDIESERRHMAR